MVNVKLIAVDLDNTLLRRDKTISDYTRSVFELCRERGILTAFVTARFEIGCKRYVKKINPDIVISSNGAIAKLHGKMIYAASPIDPDILNRIITVLKENEHSSIITAFDGGCFWNSTRIAESEVLHEAIYNDYSVPLSVPIYKILAETDDEAFMNNIADNYKELKMATYLGEPRFSFTTKEVTKLNALSQISKVMGIGIDKVAAFGDDFSDVEMLQNCGYGVAMSNAIDECKQSARYICGDCDNDGVAHWVEENILREQ